MIYISQIIMLYSLYSALCQLYLNKTGRKKMSFTCIPPSATAIWHPSMDKGTFVGAVGSSTWCLRAQEEYCPPICQIIAKQYLVPSVDPEMHHEPTPAPLGHCLGAPGEQTDLDYHPQMREPLWKSSGEVPAHFWRKKSEIICIGEGEEHIDFTSVQCQESPWLMISPAGKSESVWVRDFSSCAEHCQRTLTFLSHSI